MIKKYVDAEALKKRLGELRLVDEGDPYRVVCEEVDEMWSIQMPDRVGDHMLRDSKRICKRCGYGADKMGLINLNGDELCIACFKEEIRKEEGDEW